MFYIFQPMMILVAMLPSLFQTGRKFKKEVLFEHKKKFF
jgi:hypothetical protein